MIPAAYAGIETQLFVWMLAMVRPGAAMLIAPGFGAPSLPVQMRAVIALAIGMAAVAQGAVQLPDAGVISIDMFLLVVGEVFIGGALGMAIQIGVAAAHVAGELLSGAMGLNFSTTVDPFSGHGSPTISQALTMLATAVFFASDTHLMFLQAVYASYVTLPVGAMPPLGIAWTIASSGGIMLALGLSIALPILFAVLMVQIIMATLARTAPQLNIFSVGLPAAVLVGLILLVIGLPVLGSGIMAATSAGLDLTEQVSGLR